MTGRETDGTVPSRSPKRRAILGGLLVLVIIGAGVFWLVTAPRPVAAERLAAIMALEADPARGEMVFWAGGCSSCHAADGAEGEERLVLSGGFELTSGFGTFVAPNISPHPEAGIGNWSLEDFANALLAGLGPGNRHLYPSFPYTSYVRMSDQDVADLFAFMQTLPESDATHADHRLPFPYSMRRLLGGWKFLFFDDDPRVELAGAGEAVARGQYLVEGLGHCGECHTPRNALGGLEADQWLAGAPNPEGEGVVPNITPGSSSIGDWSAADIAYYLESGFTPDFDTVGGSMVEVQENLAELEEADRQAIAAYLKAIPAR